MAFDGEKGLWVDAGRFHHDCQSDEGVKAAAFVHLEITPAGIGPQLP
jgi:hypothetical protein